MALSITLNGPMQVGFGGGLGGGSISFTDSSGIQAPLSKIIPVLTANMTASQFGQATIGTTLSPVTLPISPTQLLYAKNESPTNTLTLTWTPVGAVSAEIMVIQPSGFMLFFNPTGGITALSVIASGAGTVVDYVLAG
jgi:hypothetical protein